MHLSSRFCWVLPVIFACTKAPAPPVDSSPAPIASVSAAPIVDAAVEAAPVVPPERANIERDFAADPKAQSLALALFDETGDVASAEREQTMDGGFRGKLHILPALPIGDDRVQLERVLAAARDYEKFFADVGLKASYRWRDLSFRFFRSASGPAGHEVPRTTPSAYADGTFTLAFNLKGSLLRSETGVRETIFHEVFHMNDAAHGDHRGGAADQGWSARTLAKDYAAILAKCGAMNVACLRPYAPNDTMVRGGTFYAFEPNNGVPVREYAAELALRWYKEHRAILRHEPLPGGRAFKCGPAENKRSWDALVKEFFAIDLVPPCP